MSSTGVWQSPPPGHTVPLTTFSGAQNVNPSHNNSFPVSAVHGVSSRQPCFAGPPHQPGPPISHGCQPQQFQPARDNNNSAGSAATAGTQQQDLAAIVSNLTEAFNNSMSFMRYELERVHALHAESRARELRCESQISDLRNELRDLREILASQNQHAGLTSPHPQLQRRFFPHPQWNKTERKIWPKLEKAPDTPATNEYLDSCSELNKALENGSSLAIEGAKCRFVEHVGNLWEADETIKVHAVGSDLSLGVGVALDCVNHAGRPDFEPNVAEVGDIIKQESEVVGGTIWHLVTKPKSSYKLHKKSEPFVLNVQHAFRRLAEEIKKEEVTDVAMSYLCSGSDRMNRVWIMNQLYNELKDVDVTVHFYNKIQSRRWRGCGQLFTPSPSPGSASASNNGSGCELNNAAPNLN